MSNKVAFTNLDVDVMKAKLSKLDDISDRIASLSKLLDDNSISNIKPAAFTTIQPSVVNGAISSGSIMSIVKNGQTKVSTKFSNDAIEIITGIKALRDSIEWADSKNAGEEESGIRLTNTTKVGAEGATAVAAASGITESSSQETYVFEKSVSLPLPNGQNLVVPAGEHDIVDSIYDENGKLRALAIMVGDRKVWVHFDENGNVEKYVVETKGISYTVTAPINYELPDGTKATIPAGTYQVLEAVYNSTGALVQMTILVNGVALEVEVKNGEIVGVINSELAEYEVKNNMNLKLPNGKSINVKSGKYKIIDAKYGPNGELEAVCIEVNGYKIWLLYLDTDGNIVKVVVIMNGETFELDMDVEYTEQNGNTVHITKGIYQLLECIYDASGNLIQIVILVDGKKITLDIKNGKVIGVVNVEEASFEVKNNFRLKLPNGDSLMITPGKYPLVDAIYVNGKLQAVCIEVDGHRIWLNLDKEGNVIQVKVVINKGRFTLDTDFEYVDANGNTIKLESGVYPLLEAIYDANGNLIQVVILVDGKRVTISIQNGKVVGAVKVEPATIKINTTMYAYASDGTLVEITPGEYKVLRYLYDRDGNIIAVVIEVGGKIVTLRYVNGHLVGIKVKPSKFTLKLPITITLPDGTTLTLNSGEYEIVDAIYDENGNIIAICIEKDGIKIWLYLDSYGNVTRVEYIKITPGVFKITSPDLVVKDKFGNILTNVNPGDYYVYETRYDKDGKPIAVRISPDGEDEVWVYLNHDSKDDILTYFDQSVQGNGGILALFEKNKSLLGVLGVLFVATGATMVLKKRKKKRQEVENSEEWEDSDETLTSGNYAVYEVQENEDSHIKSARITPDNADEEYWVEM